MDKKIMDSHSADPNRNGAGSVIVKTYKELLVKQLHRFGLFSAVKYVTRHVPVILMYHRLGTGDGSRRLDASIFSQQIVMLRERFHLVSLETLYAGLVNGKPIPPNTVVLTFDDGYEDFYVYGYPILKEYLVPATIYVTSDFIDRKVWLWPDLIEFVVNRTKYNSVSLTLDSTPRQYPLADEDGRRQAWSDIADFCLTLNNKDKDVFIRNLSKDMKVLIPETPISEYCPLSWAQIREMREHGVEVGSHTCTHPRLVMAEPSRQVIEIEASKHRIEDMINGSVDSFCYPHGTRVDLDEHVKQRVRDAGYKTAVVAYFDAKPVDDLFALRRYAVGNDMLHFNKVINGIPFISAWISQYRLKDL